MRKARVVIPRKDVESDRRLVNIKVTNQSENIMVDRKTLLRSITFSHCDVNSKMLEQMADDFDNLESLCFHHINFSLGESPEYKSFSTKKLESLKVVGCPMMLLEHFQGVHLNSFHFEDSVDAPTNKLPEFISNQTQLESLNITVTLPTFFWLFMVNQFKITGESNKLKKLSIVMHRNISTYNRISAADQDNFIHFLRLRASNLEEITISGFPPCEIFRFALTELKEMRKLSLNYSGCPASYKSYQRLEVSPNIRELSLTGSTADKRIAARVLGKFLDLESINIEFASEPIFKFITRKLRGIQSFSCSSLPTSNFHSKFKDLRELHLEEVVAVDSLVAFLKSNPSVVKVTIKKFVAYMKETEKLVSAVTHAESLKHMQLQGDTKALKLFYEAVKRIKWNCLEVLELIVNNNHENFTRPFIFYLPKDKESWQPDCPHFNDFDDLES